MVRARARQARLHLSYWCRLITLVPSVKLVMSVRDTKKTFVPGRGLVDDDDPTV